VSTTAPIKVRRKLRWGALAAFLGAALLASVFHFFLFFMLAGVQQHIGFGDILIDAAATVWTNPMVVLALIPLWILMLALGRVLALRFIKPRNAIWAYAASSAAVTVVSTILLGFVFTAIVMGVGRGAQMAITNVLYPDWWEEVVIRGLIAAGASVAHIYFIRWLKAEQPA
jgi:hypothetical protein